MSRPALSPDTSTDVGMARAPKCLAPSRPRPSAAFHRNGLASLVRWPTVRRGCRPVSPPAPPKQRDAWASPVGGWRPQSRAYRPIDDPFAARGDLHRLSGPIASSDPVILGLPVGRGAVRVQCQRSASIVLSTARPRSLRVSASSASRSACARSPSGPPRLRLACSVSPLRLPPAPRGSAARLALASLAVRRRR
jgi:hypothetical protein